MPLAWEPKTPEFIKKIQSGVSSILPPGLASLAPPSPRETGQAWKEVIEDKPTPGGAYLPFAPRVNLNKLGKAVYGTAGKLAEGMPGMEFLMPLSFKAYHGSPYKFSKFSNEKIGTGEGAQAFGYGHYVTENPEVAQYYARPKHPVVTGLDPIEINHVKSLVKEGKIDEAKNYSLSLNNIYTNAKRYDNANAWGEVHQNLIKEKPQLPKWADESSLYETTIHKGKKPGEYTYLEWDKPVNKSDMSKLLHSLPADKYDKFENLAIAAIKGEHPRSKAYTPTGAELYHDLSDILGGSDNASLFLNRAGISGIKYPTGTLSGIKGSKEYNYVVFNPEDITIEKVR